jgi:hypothetical protein
MKKEKIYWLPKTMLGTTSLLLNFAALFGNISILIPFLGWILVLFVILMAITGFVLGLIAWFIRKDRALLMLIFPAPTFILYFVMIIFWLASLS